MTELDQILGSWHGATRRTGLRLGYQTKNPLSAWALPGESADGSDEIDAQIARGEHAAVEYAMERLTGDERAVLMMHAKNCAVQASVFSSARLMARTKQEQATILDGAMDKMTKALRRAGVMV